ncbi:MAG: hypothetical protein ABIP48_12130, partial [Planctomycetota bacterium]
QLADLRGWPVYVACRGKDQPRAWGEIITVLVDEEGFSMSVGGRLGQAGGMAEGPERLLLMSGALFAVFPAKYNRGNDLLQSFNLDAASVVLGSPVLEWRIGLAPGAVHSADFCAEDEAGVIVAGQAAGGVWSACLDADDPAVVVGHPTLTPLGGQVSDAIIVRWTDLPALYFILSDSPTIGLRWLSSRSLSNP